MLLNNKALAYSVILPKVILKIQNNFDFSKQSKFYKIELFMLSIIICIRKK